MRNRICPLEDAVVEVFKLAREAPGTSELEFANHSKFCCVFVGVGELVTAGYRA